VYTSYLLRRSYREGGKVRHENLGNLSHLPLEVIDAIRKMLAGRVLVDLDEQLEIERSRPRGHVAAVLGVLRELDLERLISRERCRERELAVAMLCQLVIGPCSKLSMTRRFQQATLADELSLGAVTEPELLSAMDWLGDRQQRIENALARRHLSDGGFVLYDLSSSHVEGRCCPLAALGHNRDRKPGKLQVNWGLVCSPEGRPVSVRVHPGNTADPSTVPGVIDTIKEQFGIERVILVGDRAMITDANAATLKELGAGFVSALKTPQIRKLLNTGELQLSLFDQTNLAEISSEEFPGERLVVCRNPHLAAEHARKREDLLAATERELDKVREMVDGPRGSLKTRRCRQDRAACRPRDQQVQGRQALRPADPVVPARRPPAAKAKAASGRTPDGPPAYNLTDLIAELGTICRNQLRIGDSPHTFPRLTNPNDTQAKALTLLDVKLGT
jgi:Transposase DDE domain